MAWLQDSKGLRYPNAPEVSSAQVEVELWSNMEAKCTGANPFRTEARISRESMFGNAREPPTAPVDYTGGVVEYGTNMSITTHLMDGKVIV